MSETADIGELAKAIQPVVDYVNEIKAGKQQAQSDTEVKDIIDFFSEADGLKKMPEKLQRGFLEAHAQEDPDFNTAFNNKSSNPKAWQAAQIKARDELTEIASNLPGSKGRPDVGGPSPEQLMKMTAWEWREYKEKKEELAESAGAR